FLMKNQGKVVTKAEIVQAVWNRPADAAVLRVLESKIGALGKKLTTASAEAGALVENVSGKGVIFNPAAAPPPTKVGPLTVGLNQVSVAGTPVDLAQRGRQILDFLMKNQGRVVTKAEIVQAIWKVPADAAALKSLEVQFAALRTKLTTASPEAGA